MQKAPILSLFASALLVGWFAPSLSAGLEAQGEGQGGGVHIVDPSEASRFADEPESETSGDSQSQLRRSQDGHFYANVSVDSQDYRFLVDTGASVVALTGEDASAMGLYWDESDLRPIGRGASGTVHGVPTVIEHMELDGIEASNVEAAIIPEGLDVSLLGQSFLSKVDVSISGETMKLGN